jgi:broad specificity phosphatase PhoE
MIVVGEPKYLILVRHADVVIDPAQAAREWSLSDNGRNACMTLAPKIAPYRPQQMISSEENKATVTGRLVASALGIPWTATPGLQEHDRQGVPFFASKTQFETAVATLLRQPDDLIFGNETANQARKRFTKAVQQQLNSHPNVTIAITTHGTVITLFTCHHNPHLNLIEFWRNLTMPCAVILKLPSMKLHTVICHS